MTGNRVAIATLAFTMCAGVLQAQPTPEAVAAAHGRPGENLEIRGVARSVGADVVVAESPFLLKISGDRSRLEMDGKVFVRVGVFGQWWNNEGGARSSPARSAAR